MLFIHERKRLYLFALPIAVLSSIFIHLHNFYILMDAELNILNSHILKGEFPFECEKLKECWFIKNVETEVKTPPRKPFMLFRASIPAVLIVV